MTSEELNKDNPEDRLLSIEDAVKYLNVSRNTLYDWINNEGLPAIKIGRILRIRKESLDTWIKDQEDLSDLGPEVREWVTSVEKAMNIVYRILQRLTTTTVKKLEEMTELSSDEIREAVHALEAKRIIVNEEISNPYDGNYIDSRIYLIPRL